LDDASKILNGHANLSSSGNSNGTHYCCETDNCNTDLHSMLDLSQNSTVTQMEGTVGTPAKTISNSTVAQIGSSSSLKDARKPANEPANDEVRIPVFLSFIISTLVEKLNLSEICDWRRINGSLFIICGRIYEEKADTKSAPK
jgi:hypothetical protein